MDIRNLQRIIYRQLLGLASSVMIALRLVLKILGAFCPERIVLSPWHRIFFYIMIWRLIKRITFASRHLNDWNGAFLRLLSLKLFIFVYYLRDLIVKSAFHYVYHVITQIKLIIFSARFQLPPFRWQISKYVKSCLFVLIHIFFVIRRKYPPFERAAGRLLVPFIESVARSDGLLLIKAGQNVSLWTLSVVLVIIASQDVGQGAILEEVWRAFH